MSGLTDTRVRELLQEIRPADRGDPPRRDLWPAVRASVAAPSRRFAAADWLLLTALTLLCVLQPSALRLLLFHF